MIASGILGGFFADAKGIANPLPTSKRKSNKYY
jgi:hypothetical protein